MPKSAVAAILGKDGMRVVIDLPQKLKNHLTEGEILEIIPDFWVQEPIDWEAIPSIVERVQKHLKWQS